MGPIRLIVTDLDGTLIGERDEYDVYDTFRVRIEELAQRHGTLWAVSTGRSIRNFRRLFRPLLSLGIVPDYVIVRHAYVYSIGRWGYWPHWVWNAQTRVDVIRGRLHSRRLLRRCHRVLRAQFRRVRTRYIEDDKLCLHFRDAKTMGLAAEVARTIARSHRDLRIVETVADLVVMTVPSTKGLAMAHLAEHLGVPREGILAIGDGLNDISMLDGSVAGMAACPSNAHPEVLQVVHGTGGHIAGEPYLSGTLECIDAFEGGNVRSELPSRVEAAASDALSYRTHGRRRHRRGVESSDAVMFLLFWIAVILALASCGALGSLSPWVMKPFDFLARALAAWVDRF